MQHNNATSAQNQPIAPASAPFDAVKALADFIADYRKLINNIMQYPINPNMRVYALLNFDQGMLWIKEALQTLQFAQQQAQPVTPKRTRKKAKKGRK